MDTSNTGGDNDSASDSNPSPRQKPDILAELELRNRAAGRKILSAYVDLGPDKLYQFRKQRGDFLGRDGGVA